MDRPLRAVSVRYTYTEPRDIDMIPGHTYRVDYRGAVAKNTRARSVTGRFIGLDEATVVMRESGSKGRLYSIPQRSITYVSELRT